MNTSKLIGMILIVVSLVIAYFGFNQISDNSAEVKVLGMEVNMSNESGKQQGYLYLGLAVVIFAGGIYTLTRSGK